MHEMQHFPGQGKEHHPKAGVTHIVVGGRYVGSSLELAGSMWRPLGQGVGQHHSLSQGTGCVGQELRAGRGLGLRHHPCGHCHSCGLGVVHGGQRHWAGALHHHSIADLHNSSATSGHAAWQGQ